MNAQRVLDPRKNIFALPVIIFLFKRGQELKMEDHIPILPPRPPFEDVPNSQEECLQRIELGFVNGFSQLMQGLVDVTKNIDNIPNSVVDLLQDRSDISLGIAPVSERKETHDSDNTWLRHTDVSLQCSCRQLGNRPTTPSPRVNRPSPHWGAHGKTRIERHGDQSHEAV